MKSEKGFCENSQEMPSKFDGCPKNKKEQEDFVDENPDFAIILIWRNNGNVFVKSCSCFGRRFRMLLPLRPGLPARKGPGM